MHQKRIAAPKSWPISKTGTKYVTKAYPGRMKKYSIPILIVLREMLKLADTKNEIKKILSAKEISVNNKIIYDHKFPVGIFDVISIPKIGKNYVILFKNKKLNAEETKHSDTKICKVTGKTLLAGKKQQINLFGGSNVLSNEKVRINDSVLLSLKDNKIIKILPLKEKANVYVMGGSHLGESGVVEKVEGKIALIKINKQPVHISLDNIMVME
jgi:small subunit ribosomal protein S4e